MCVFLYNLEPSKRLVTNWRVNIVPTSLLKCCH